MKRSSKKPKINPATTPAASPSAPVRLTHQELLAHFDKAFLAERFEDEIRKGEIASKEHLFALLRNLVGQPLSKTIIDYLCDVISGKQGFSQTELQRRYQFAEMLAFFIPAYNDVLKRIQQEPDANVGAPAHVKATMMVFRDIMERQNVNVLHMKNEMSKAKKFMTKHGLEDLHERACHTPIEQRSALVPEIMARLKPIS